MIFGNSIAIFFVTIFIGCGVSMSSEKGPLNLSGNQYWDAPFSNAEDIGMDRLSQELEGMVIDVPPKVYANERKSIPLISLRTQSKEKDRKYSLETTTQLILTHLESGTIQNVKLARSPDIRDTGPVSKGWSNEWLESNIKEITNLGPSLGRYQVWLACGPLASNTVSFELYPSKAAEHGKEVKDRLSDMRKGIGDSEFIDGERSPLIKIAPYAPSDLGKDALLLSREGKGPDELEIKVKFRIVGLEKYLMPPAKLIKDNSGRITYAWLPLVLIGFTKDHDFAYENTFLIPVVEKPKGTLESPILEGSVSFLLHKDPEFRSASVASLWATTLNHRALIEIQPSSTGAGNSDSKGEGKK